MYIKALELNNFKKFKKARIEFPGDITTIKGNNEQGKSTLVEALLAALFFDPTLPSVPNYIKEYQSWNSKKLYKLILYFEYAGEDFILEKDFENQKIILKKNSGDVISHDFEEISKKLSKMGGYTNRELFSSVGVIRKDSLILLNAGKKKIMEALQEMVTGSGVSVSVGQIIKRVQDAQTRLAKGDSSNSIVKKVGKIKLLRNTVEEAQKSFEKIKQDSLKKQQALEELSELEEKLSKALEREIILKHEYNTNEKYFKSKIESGKIEQDLERVLEDLEAYERLGKEKNEFSELLLNLRIPKRVDLEKTENLNRNIDSVQDRVNDLKKTILSLKLKHQKSYYPSRNIFFTVTAFLALVGLAGLWIKLFFVFWVLLMVFVAFYFLSGQYKESLKRVELEKEEKHKKQILKELQKELDNIFVRFNVSTLGEFRDISSKIKELGKSVESLEKQQGTVLRNKKLSELEKQKKELQNRLAVEEEKITDEHKVIPPQSSRQRELEKRMESLKKELENTKEKKLTMKARIENISVSAEDVLELEEEISNFIKQIEVLERRVKKYDILLDVLTEARDKSLIKTKEALQNMMSEYISEITNGKYTSVRLSNTLDVQVYSHEKGDYLGAEYLSTGAVDQLYLVARFALINILYGKIPTEEFSRRPIVILDDPFGSFDEERREKVRGISERLSKDFQVVLFTCVSNYDDWGKLVVI